MAKIKINFDDSLYNIDESSLSSPLAELQSHFLNKMNGSGEVLHLGGTSYNIDSTKLSNTANKFITHLGTIAGDGKKVRVNNTEYSIDSTKVSKAVEDIRAILNNLNDPSNDTYTITYNLDGGTQGYRIDYFGGTTITWDGDTSGLATYDDQYYKISDITFTEEEINSGFLINYFNGDKIVSYDIINAYVDYYYPEIYIDNPEPYPMIRINLEYEPGIYLFKSNDPCYVTSFTCGGQQEIVVNPETYTSDTETFTLISPVKDNYEFLGWISSNNSTPQKEIIIPTGSSGDLEYTAVYRLDYIYTTVDNVTYLPDDGMPATVQNGDIFICGDYEYRYNNVFSDYAHVWYEDESINGWNARVASPNKKSYGSILENINGKPVTGMYNTYHECRYFEDASKVQIPNTVTHIRGAFSGCERLKDISHLIIPNAVTNMTDTFTGCDTIEKSPAIPYGVIYMDRAFSGCNALREAPEIPESVTSLSSTFKYTAIKTAPVIPSNVEYLSNTFSYCTELTGEVVINANPTYYSSCFANTVQPIIITGSTTLKAELAATSKNGNVTYVE